jgi:hypothetical protein
MIGRLYYYFVAGLPAIHWNGKCPMSVEDFLSAAQRLLCADESMLLQQLLTGQSDDAKTDNAAAIAWIRFNRNFRNEIASFRAQRMHKDPQKETRGIKESEPRLREIIQEASKIPDLLEAEKLIDQTAWQFLDDLEGGHHFDLEYLICYGLKLKMLECYQEYHSPKGNNVFDGFRSMKLPVDRAVSGNGNY